MVPDVADDPCDPNDPFLDASPVSPLLSVETDGFLNSPVTEGFDLIGRAARVFDPYFTAGILAGRSGLGVLDLWTGGVNDVDILVAEARSDGVCAVFDKGVLRDLILTRPLEGVPSMVVSGFL